MSQASEWLTPNSPAAPSAFGALLVTVSMPLGDALGISFKMITLILSVALGTLVALSIKEEMTRALRCLYGLFNSLLVFSVSMGIGISATPPPLATPPVPPELQQLLEPSKPTPTVGWWPDMLGIGSANAQVSLPPNPPVAPPQRPVTTVPEYKQPLQLTEDQREALRKYIEAQKAYQKSQQQYHKKWSW